MIEIKNEHETKELAKEIAGKLEPGMVILLDGELGAGKTTFTKGLAQGLDISRIIKSPTYTIVREYNQGRLPLYHMDLYRLGESDVENLGLDDYFYGEGISVIEWGSNAESELPTNYLKVKLQTVLDDPNARRIELEAVGTQYEKLLEVLND